MRRYRIVHRGRLGRKALPDASFDLHRSLTLIATLATATTTATAAPARTPWLLVTGLERVRYFLTLLVGNIVAVVVAGRLVARRVAGDRLAPLVALLSARATATTPAAAAAARAVALLAGMALVALLLAFVGAILVLRLVLFLDFVIDLVVIGIIDDCGRCSANRRNRLGARAVDRHACALEALVDQNLDLNAIALLDLGELGALLVEHIDRRFASGAQADAIAATACSLVLDQAQRTESRRRCRAHQAGALAMPARSGRCLEHTRAQSLAAHFRQPERADPANLNARAIIAQRVLHRLLDFADMARLLHVDEIDHDQPGHVAQFQLARDLVGRLDVGRVGGLLDVMLARRAPRVDVD